MEGRNEMFHLMIHSIHFILRLYGIGHIINNHGAMDHQINHTFRPIELILISVSTP